MTKTIPNGTLEFTFKEVHKQKWIIMAPTGKIISEEFYFANVRDAENYCKAYISYYNNATYKMEGLNVQNQM